MGYIQLHALGRNSITVLVFNGNNIIGDTLTSVFVLTSHVE